MTTNQEELKKIVHQITQEHLPGYSDGPIEFTSLCGMTNETYKIRLSNGKTAVFRKLSSIIDRKVEGEIVKQLSKINVSPHVYFTSLEYRLEEFVQGGEHAFCKDILENEEILSAVIDKINEFHQVQMPETVPKEIFAHEMFNEHSFKTCQESKGHSSYSPKEFNKLKDEILVLFPQVQKYVSENFTPKTTKVSFCHNDLNALNIFILKGANKTIESLLIDFEYSGYNYIAYDLANFMNETTISYIEKYPGFEIVNKISKEHIHKVCNLYFQSQNKKENQKLNYSNLEKDVGKMLMIVNFYWAIWSLKTQPTKSSPTFCPLKHGIMRFELYKEYKKMYAD